LTCRTGRRAMGPTYGYGLEAFGKVDQDHTLTIFS
jgi:hypothetical protein